METLKLQEDLKAYSIALAGILDAHMQKAKETLTVALSKLPQETKELQFGIHPNQEPDGMFSVILHLVGPNLFTLNKAINGHRVLFDVRFVDGKIKPDVPMLDPFDQPFSVNNAIVETAASWLEKIWDTIDRKADCPPTLIFGEDGWGEGMPKRLS